MNGSFADDWDSRGDGPAGGDDGLCGLDDELLERLLEATDAESLPAPLRPSPRSWSPSGRRPRRRNSPARPTPSPSSERHGADRTWPGLLTLGARAVAPQQSPSPPR